MDAIGAGDLRAALNEIEAIQRSLGAVVDRTDPQRAHVLIKLRSALSAQFDTVSRLGKLYFGEGGAEFRHHLSAMRAAAAGLQASWPAVVVRDLTDDSYRAAVAKVRANDVECMRRIRSAIDLAESAS